MFFCWGRRQVKCFWTISTEIVFWRGIGTCWFWVHGVSRRYGYGNLHTFLGRFDNILNLGLRQWTMARVEFLIPIDFIPNIAAPFLQIDISQTRCFNFWLSKLRSWVTWSRGRIKVEVKKWWSGLKAGVMDLDGWWILNKWVSTVVIVWNRL